MWVGVVLFLAGLATLFYPPLRAIVGSVTTSTAICAGGLALIILPTLVVGNELLIMGGVAVLVGGWFLATRYGRQWGFVDANKNGVDDREEGCAGAVKTKNCPLFLSAFCRHLDGRFV